MLIPALIILTLLGSLLFARVIYRLGSYGFPILPGGSVA